MKNYSKAMVVAQNSPEGSYAAGCPTNIGKDTSSSSCKKCECTR